MKYLLVYLLFAVYSLFFIAITFLTAFLVGVEIVNRFDWRGLIGIAVLIYISADCVSELRKLKKRLATYRSFDRNMEQAKKAIAEKSEARFFCAMEQAESDLERMRP